MSYKSKNGPDLDGFRTAVESLKLYRRADLIEEENGEPLIETLYVDPLPEDDVFKTSFRPNTTFLIGRKGTGKSTVFQRLQHEIRKTNNKTSAYLDIKTIYESSQPDQHLVAKLQSHSNAIPRESIERISLYKEFLRSIIRQIQEELQKRIEQSIWNRIKEKFTGSHADLIKSLDQLIDNAFEDRFISALGLMETRVTSAVSHGSTDEIAVKSSIDLSQKPSLNFSDEEKSTHKEDSSLTLDYTNILIRAFDVRRFIERIKELLSSLGIRHLYVLVDDFSELPADAMKIVVDTVIAPLNNWSDEFIKFKIAAYPGRIYYGEIDRTKIDEVYLDVFSLFGVSDVATMEASAIVFTRRLIESRINHFSISGIDEFFEGKSDDIWRALFSASMANPRVLGYVLHFAYQNQLIHGKPIGIKSIQEAALKYYEEKIASYFETGKFLHEAFTERCSIYSLKELLEQIVGRARELRTHKSGIFDKLVGRPPTSHFHVTPADETLLSTLELNFFLTKYFEMSDRDGRKVSVFALNYGLCQRYSITFGRPSGEREFRTYFIERVFDYSPIVRAFLQQNQEISCDSCGEIHDFSKLEALQFYGMRCPSCKDGICRVTNLSRKYEPMLKGIDEALLLPRTEIGILQTLRTESSPKRPAFVAGELDCSYQLISRRAINLEDRGLVKRTSNDKDQRLLEITELAEKSYFSDFESRTLDLPLQPDKG